MKQRITVVQFAELTDEQQEKVLNWWQPQSYDVVLTKDGNEVVVLNLQEDSWNQWVLSNGEVYEKADLTPLLSVGQIFQLIAEVGQYKFGQFLDVGYETTPRSIALSWMMDLMEPHGNRVIKVREFGGDLCDLVWHAAKQSI